LYSIGIGCAEFLVRQSILLVQDNPADAIAVRGALLNSDDGPFHVDWVRSCAAGIERMLGTGDDAAQHKDLIAAVLVDLFLPDSAGIETFERLFRVAAGTPILVLCASAHENIAKLAVQRGAQDYLLKGRLDAYLLPKALSSMVERAAYADALFAEKERAQITLNSIGDAVLSTDVSGSVTYLNAAAEQLTGWKLAEAIGLPLEQVLRIVDASTHEPAPNPMTAAIEQNKMVGLAPNCLLVRRDGGESAIEDSVAPIHDRRGTVTGAVMVFRDVTTRRALSLQMAHLAQHDSLTDLPNRMLLMDRLQQAIALAHRRERRLALIFLDIDRFKHINDSLGHAIGDRLLQSVGKRLLASVRRADTVSRQGGDEFVILLSDVTRIEDATVCAETILAALRESHFIDKHDLHVTASLGISTFPDDGADSETLLKHADAAMYHAKVCGRDGYQFFKAEMNTRAVERQSLEVGLRGALARREFELNYQPKVDLATGAMIGVEALIRWHHPRRGLVPPAQFIPVAEESALIVPIGRWVLHEACRQQRAWEDAGLRAIPIAINVSAAELRTKDFVAGVRETLAETGLNPHCLEFELTETCLLQDSTSTSAILRDLKEMGVRLTLDDFGTGYSSLSFLQKFPIDTLKIDQSFIRDLTTDPGDASIVNAVIGMGDSLHMTVVAEGIETREQLVFLRESRCPEGQGDYFSRPVAAGKFATLLEPRAVEAARGSW